LRARPRSAESAMWVCSGSALFARAGLLDGRRATSNKIFFELARSQSEKVDWVEQARGGEGGPGAEAVPLVTEYQWHTDSARDPFAAQLNQTHWMAKAAGSTAS